MLRYKLAILLGIIAVIVAADYLLRSYRAEQLTFTRLCTYPFESQCGCAQQDKTCLQQCDQLRQRSEANCLEELQPTLYKLQDRYTWKFLLGLSAAFALTFGLTRALQQWWRRR